MTWCYGEDYEYANSRLAGTYVKHQGKVVRVEHVSAGGRASITDLQREESIINAKELDTSPIKLGFANVEGYINSIKRIPVRRYRQGLCPENVLVDGVGRGDLRKVLSALSTPYPTYEEALAKVSCGEAKKVAWHPHWGLASPKTVCYRRIGNIVGGVDKNGKVVLSKKHQHLQQALEESYENCTAVVEA